MTSASLDVQSPADTPAVVLTIAGSEATGGAGAQSDLKTFQELGVIGIANLTCIVSFNPNDDWNHRFVPVDQQVIADQLEATTAAYGPAPDGQSVPGRPVLDTVKIGMLGSPATIATVADKSSWMPGRGGRHTEYGLPKSSKKARFRSSGVMRWPTASR